jgi:hypothetical protein
MFFVITYAFLGTWSIVMAVMNFMVFVNYGHGWNLLCGVFFTAIGIWLFSESSRTAKRLK